mmetsp:Transcript_1919/g.5984  ORF Transcript_1919/g.5984 Transcript_1919/m.5984 type:complete len:235 (+) Transcript_1919:3012-3716(+)
MHVQHGVRFVETQRLTKTVPRLHQSIDVLLDDWRRCRTGLSGRGWQSFVGIAPVGTSTLVCCGGGRGRIVIIVVRVIGETIARKVFHLEAPCSRCGQVVVELGVHFLGHAHNAVLESLNPFQVGTGKTSLLVIRLHFLQGNNGSLVQAATNLRLGKKFFWIQYIIFWFGIENHLPLFEKHDAIQIKIPHVGWVNKLNGADQVTTNNEFLDTREFLVTHLVQLVERRDGEIVLAR